GTITDKSKAVLPGATVTATNLETGSQTASVTDGRGEYRLQQLPAGRYKLQADLPSFATVVIPSVELLVGQNATVPFILKLPQLSETLTITGDSPRLQKRHPRLEGRGAARRLQLQRQRK